MVECEGKWTDLLLLRSQEPLIGQFAQEGFVVPQLHTPCPANERPVRQVAGVVLGVVELREPKEPANQLAGDPGDFGLPVWLGNLPYNLRDDSLDPALVLPHGKPLGGSGW
jgi:hypothetical protein